MLKPILQTLLLAVFLLCPDLARAGILTQEEARAVAAGFFESGDITRLADAESLTLAHVENVGSTPSYYIFNAKEGGGFIIVSASDTAIPVIGYSVTSTWEPGNVPQAAGQMVGDAAASIRTPLRKAPARAAGSGSKVLKTPSWSQEAPFNNMIPNRRLVGCVGTALAEILKYHKYPANRPASLVKDGEPTAYAWDSMRDDNYRSGYSAAEAAAVAALVADAAISIGTDFGMSSSSAFEVKVPSALVSMFGYDAGVSYKKRVEMDKDAWETLIVNEIDEGRPVLYSGQDVSSGHAFVCDGYDIRGNATYFHINWGWGGSADGFFASDALNPTVSTTHHFNNLMTVVYNIKPAAGAGEWSPVHVTSDERQVGLTVDVTDFTPGATVSVRAGALKNISNENFSGKVSLALFNADGSFRQLLGEGRNLGIQSLQIVKYIDFSITVPADAAVGDGDVVRLVTKDNASTAWLPVANDLLTIGEVKAKGNAIPYFDINIPSAVEGVEITCADPRVIKGRDFSFKVVSGTPDKVVTVKANGFIMTPDASNGYRISNVCENQEIKIIVQNASEVLEKSNLWLQAGKLSQLIGDKESGTIVDLTLYGTMDVNDFTFIRERMKLKRLDISQVNIVANGSNPANAIPAKAFKGYGSLESIILPGNVTTFKSGCFSYTGLRSIEIPASVSTYEYNVFLGCGNLREVTVRRYSPAWVNWCVFQGTPKARLVVPVGATDGYKSKENWMDFKEVVEGSAETPDHYSVMLQEKAGVSLTALTEGTEVAPGSEYRFKVLTDDSFGDAVMEVYANNTRLYPDSEGVYKTTVRSNTLLHVNFRQPQATHDDASWKITGATGGQGLVTDVVNVTPGKAFTIRVNALSIPDSDQACKYYCAVLTDKDGGIKEQISTVYNNWRTTFGNLTFNITCKVNEAGVREGNYVRLATSYDKKNWYLVGSDGSGISDRISAIGNRVEYCNVNMPQTVEGAVIQGYATQVVKGMPYSVRVVPVSNYDRVTLAVNGVNKVVKGTEASWSVPAMTEDVEISIQVNAADANDYVVVNVREGELAGKIAACPSRLKVLGTILSSEFDAFRKNCGTIVDLDLSGVTIKGDASTRDAIPSNAFAPANAVATSALKTVILPNGLTSIADNAFARCGNLSEITLPQGVNYVGSGAFSSCIGLKKIIMLGSTPPYTGNMSPFPANNAGNIILEVPQGSENVYSAASYWKDLGLNAAKVYYKIIVDPTRAFGYNDRYDLAKLDGSNESVSLVMPNYCEGYKPDRVHRPGEAFKIYDDGTEMNRYASFLEYGQYAVSFSGAANKRDHTIDIVFFYGITFQIDKPDAVSAEFVELDESDVWRNVDMTKFGYTGTKPVLYREARDYKFRLNTVSPNIKPIVKVENKIITKMGINAQYEWPMETVLPDEDGVYTIKDLPGNSWVKIACSVVPEEGEPVGSNDLVAINKEDVSSFTELAVTGNMDESAFKAVRDNFESVETLDLSLVENINIPAKAFAEMKSLRNVIMPDNISEIGVGSFKGCENLESVTFSGINSIGEGAFEGCTSLTSIIIPSTGAAAGTRAGEGSGITAASFKGVNPNCLIYLPEGQSIVADSLNVIVNKGGGRVATSDIVLNGNYPFNAPASFNLDGHRISFTLDIPGSKGNDVDGGWKGVMLPFAPTSMKFGAEFTSRGDEHPLRLLSFENEDANTMTRQTSIKANRPYLANMTAPFESVPVTFYAEGNNGESMAAADGNAAPSYDVEYTPLPEETVSKGLNFSLYGSYNGESRLGSLYALNETGDTYIRVASAADFNVTPFSTYLCANNGVAEDMFKVGEHPIWVFDPEASKENGSKIYRSSRIELSTPTAGAAIYYTLDSTDPATSMTRKEYSAESPLTVAGDESVLKVMTVAEYKGYCSDSVELVYELRNADKEYSLDDGWHWISHNVEKEIPVDDVMVDGVYRVLSQTQEMIRDPKLGKVGNLKTLNSLEAYKVHVTAENANAAVKGIAFDPSTPVAIGKGWNWIGCPMEQEAIALDDAFANLKAEEGDMIVGRGGFSQADAEGNWVGTLTTLSLGEGYLYFSGTDKEFCYNVTPSAENAPALAKAPAKDGAASRWNVVSRKYPSVMPVTSLLVKENGIEAGEGEFAIAAFCDGECRGVGVYVDGWVMMNVYGNPGDKISFRVVSEATDMETPLSQTLEFSEDPVGKLSEPYRFVLPISSSVSLVEDGEYGLSIENGVLSIKGDTSSIELVEVYDVAGMKVAESRNTTDGALGIGNLKAGVHIVVIYTDNGKVSKKIEIE